MPDPSSRLRQSPSQTAGPYLHIGLMPGLCDPEQREEGDRVARPNAGPGEPVRIEGRILDGAGEPVRDAMVEVWQADSDGVFRHGFGRAACDEAGSFIIESVKPAAGLGSAPHLTLWMVARGINTGLHTRLYFDDDPGAHTTDRVLQAVPETRRHTLIASTLAAGSTRRYGFAIRLQGDDETVFFDI